MKLLLTLIFFYTSIFTYATCSKSLKTAFSNKQLIFDRDSPFYTSSNKLWNLPGGKGENIRVVDVEKAFQKDHPVFEDINLSFVKHPSSVFDSRQTQEYHGTAVLSIIGSGHENPRMMGLAPKAELGFVSYYSDFKNIFSLNTYQEFYDVITNHLSNSFVRAAEQLREGDVLLVEVQVPIWSHSLNSIIPGSLVPPSFYSPVREILNKISERGIHVVISAGNMGQDFNETYFKDRLSRNFNSNLIYVGSTIQEGNHLLRSSKSNHGDLIDIYGPGEKVFAAGRFPNQENQLYSANFSGTSSGGAVVAGLITQVLGLAKAQGKVISPERLRLALKKAGKPVFNNKEIVGTYLDAYLLAEKLGLII